MNYNNLNLRERTFLDFTDDKEIIATIIGNDSRDSINSFLSHITEYERVQTFIDFADYTPDKRLSNAIKKEFKDEIETLFDE